SWTRAKRKAQSGESGTRRVAESGLFSPLAPMRHDDAYGQDISRKHLPPEGAAACKNQRVVLGVILRVVRARPCAELAACSPPPYGRSLRRNVQ
ncbi:MAG: hypothetical protein RKP46_05550, partial [Candidatus Accumulibacter sp.]|uniref:hypothetical protein n=1 Tax=Accumulibacter sp. TaxID=2053492 RepID=UPI002878CF8F